MSKIYWKEKHAIIEDGVQRPAGSEDVSGLPLFEESDKYRAIEAEQRKREIMEELELVEKAAIRNIIALTDGEDATERGYLNQRKAKIEALRRELRTL